MGDERHAEDPHPGPGFGPKLTAAGRLQGTLDGRPVAIEADGRQLELRLPTIRSAWRLRRGAGVEALASLLPLLQRSGLTLRIRVGRHLSFTAPAGRPGALLRLLSPALRA